LNWKYGDTISSSVGVTRSKNYGETALGIGAEILGSVLVKAAGWVGLISVVTLWIRNITKDFDDDLSPETRERLVEQLRINTAPNAAWMIIFQQLFTNVFGSRHFSWLCFRRSVAISASTFVLLGIGFGTFIIDTSGLNKVGPFWPYIMWAVWLTFLIIVGIVYNGLLDYVSLLKARLIIRSSQPIPIKILLEILLTAIIIRAGFFVLIFLLMYSGLSVSIDAAKVADTHTASSVLILFILFMLQFAKFPPFFGTVAFVMFATSYTVSVWVIINALSAWVIRLVPALFSALNVAQKPVRALGVVSILFIWLFGLSVAAIVIIVSPLQGH
jgi:hypothetical protein